MTKRYTLSAAERLKSKKSIDSLFGTGQRISLGCLRIFHARSGEPGVRIGVGVSAKNFRRAVDRNRIKRQLRECYRLQKDILHTVSLQKPGLDIFFVYTDKELPDYQPLFSQMQKALTKLLAIHQAA